MTLIDIHCHVFPKVYLDVLESCGQILYDSQSESRFIIETGKDTGHKIKLFEAMWNTEIRLKSMDKIGVDIEVLSIGNPWISYVPAEKSKDAARALNTELAGMVKDNPKRFVAMGVLPVNSSPEDVLDELDYGIDELGLRGYMVGTHVVGKPISSEQFLPFFEEAARKDVPIYVHPLAMPRVGERYDRLTVTGLIFPTETSIAATWLMLSGLLDKSPDVKIILAHLGGMIPFSVGRIERAIETNPTKVKLKSKGRDYLRKFYMDSIAYYAPAIDYTVSLWGAEKVMLGTDYPYAWCDEYEHVVGPIKESNLQNGEKEQILSENAARLFKINS